MGGDYQAPPPRNDYYQGSSPQCYLYYTLSQPDEYVSNMSSQNPGGYQQPPRQDEYYPPPRRDDYRLYEWYERSIVVTSSACYPADVPLTLHP